MKFNIIHIFQVMGPFQMAVVITLVLMAMASLAVFVERVWVVARSWR